MTKLNRKRLTLGLATLGLVSGLAGGGVALAATTAPSQTTPASGASTSWAGTGMYGMAFGANNATSGVASYLGLSQADLHNRMRSGQSLADIAKAQGKSLSGLEDAMVAAMKSSLAANTSLTAAQRAAILAQMRSHLDTMLTRTHMSGAGMDMDDMGTAMMGGTGTGMMGG